MLAHSSSLPKQNPKLTTPTLSARCLGVRLSAPCTVDFKGVSDKPYGMLHEYLRILIIRGSTSVGSTGICAPHSTTTQCTTFPIPTAISWLTYVINELSILGIGESMFVLYLLGNVRESLEATGTTGGCQN